MGCTWGLPWMVMLSWKAFDAEFISARREHGAGEEGNPDDDAYEHEVQEAAACYSDEDLDEIDSPDEADSADEDTVDRMIVKYM